MISEFFTKTLEQEGNCEPHHHRQAAAHILENPSPKYVGRVISFNKSARYVNVSKCSQHAAMHIYDSLGATMLRYSSQRKQQFVFDMMAKGNTLSRKVLICKGKQSSMRISRGYHEDWIAHTKNVLDCQAWCASYEVVKVDVRESHLDELRPSMRIETATVAG